MLFVFIVAGLLLAVGFCHALSYFLCYYCIWWSLLGIVIISLGRRELVALLFLWFVACVLSVIYSLFFLLVSVVGNVL